MDVPPRGVERVRVEHDRLGGRVVGGGERHEELLLERRLVLEGEEAPALPGQVGPAGRARGQELVEALAYAGRRREGIEVRTRALVLLAAPGADVGIVPVLEPSPRVLHGDPVIRVHRRRVRGRGRCRLRLGRSGRRLRRLRSTRGGEDREGGGHADATEDSLVAPAHGLPPGKTAVYLRRCETRPKSCGIRPPE